MMGEKFSKQKTEANLRQAQARINIMRSKKLGEIAKAKDQICKHLEAGQEVNAVIWGENLIQDEGMIPVYDVMNSYCDQLMGRCTYMEKFGVPKDMNQCFATVLYAAPRLDCKELDAVRKQFQLLLDKQFVKEVDAEGVFVHPVVKANIDIYIKEKGAVCHRLVTLARERNIDFMLTHENQMVFNKYIDEKGLQDESVQANPVYTPNQQYQPPSGSQPMPPPA